MAAAAQRPMRESIFVIGTLAARERSTLSAKVPGRLTELRVDIGTPVESGMLLAQIEKRDYELRVAQAAAALAQTRAALGLPADGQTDRVELAEIASVKQSAAVLDEARKNRDRVGDLTKSGIVPQSELDSAEAAYTVAHARHESAQEEARTRMAALAQRRAELDLATKQLADTSILAPYDGVVQSRRANMGEYLVAGAPVLHVVKADPLRLRLEVPERSSALVRAGQEVLLWVEGDTNAYSGTVVRLSPALEEDTRMLVIEADVPARGALRAGLFARAEIVINKEKPGLAIPENALIKFAGVQKVVGILEGKAVEKIVATGRSGPGWIEITSGLSAGEEVILDPAGLRTGQPVRIASQAPSADSAATSALTVLDAKAR